MDASQCSALSKKANNLELSLFLGTKSNSKMVTGCVAKHIWYTLCTLNTFGSICASVQPVCISTFTLTMRGNQVDNSLY